MRLQPLFVVVPVAGGVLGASRASHAARSRPAGRLAVVRSGPVRRPGRRFSAVANPATRVQGVPRRGGRD